MEDGQEVIWGIGGSNHKLWPLQGLAEENLKRRDLVFEGRVGKQNITLMAEAFNK